jgi:predicted anti-sigma-YlaC factor YlaD
VNEACSKARDSLETGGLPVRSEVRAHLNECPACRAHAALLAILAELAPSEADPVTVRAVMTALPPAPWQKRRFAAWLPLAAGLAFVAAGMLLLGGVPASGTVAQLPAAAGGVLGWIASSALDALTAARGGSDAAKMLVAVGGSWLVVWLALAALGGSWAMVSLVGRARRGAGQ